MQESQGMTSLTTTKLQQVHNRTKWKGKKPQKRETATLSLDYDNNGPVISPDSRITKIRDNAAFHSGIRKIGKCSRFHLFGGPGLCRCPCYFLSITENSGLSQKIEVFDFLNSPAHKGSVLKYPFGSDSPHLTFNPLWIKGNSESHPGCILLPLAIAILPD